MEEGFPDLTHLIRSIQRSEGNPDCFGTAKGYCDKKNCVWREYCLKKIDGGLTASNNPPETDAQREYRQSYQK